MSEAIKLKVGQTWRASDTTVTRIPDDERGIHMYDVLSPGGSWKDTLMQNVAMGMLIITCQNPKGETYKVVFQA